MATKEQVLQFIRDRKTAYSQVFADNLASREVLSDLRKFCRADASTFHVDARVAAALDGRREVMLRILDYTTLTIDELYEKYGKGNTNGG